MPFGAVLGLLKDEEPGLDHDGEDDEGEGEEEGVGERPSEEVGAEVVAGESSHEEGEDEGHGEGDALGHLPHAAAALFGLEVVVAVGLGVELPQLPHLALVAQLLNHPPLLR